MFKNHSVHIIATYALFLLASPLIWTSDASAQANCTSFFCTGSAGFGQGVQTTSQGVQTNVTESNSFFYTGPSAVTPQVPAAAPQAPTVTVQAPAPNTVSVLVLCNRFDSDLGLGSSGPKVTDLQTYLRAVGILPVIPSGFYDYNTEQAVRSFQLRSGLPGSGILNAETRSRLQASCLATPQGTRIGVANPVVAPTSQDDRYYFCGGSAPMGAGVERGAQLYRVGDAANQWTFTTGDPGPCQWTCSSGYGLSNDSCAIAGTARPAEIARRSCGGREPQQNGYTSRGAGSYTTGYGTVNWTFVAANPAACQYSCINGGSYDGSGCVAPAPAVSQRPEANGLTWVSNTTDVAAGRQFSITVMNSGTKAWGASHDLGLSSSNQVLQLRNLGMTTPGGTKTVTFTAPTGIGSYKLQAVEQGVEWFGSIRIINLTN